MTGGRGRGRGAGALRGPNRGRGGASNVTRNTTTSEGLETLKTGTLLRRGNGRGTVRGTGRGGADTRGRGASHLKASSTGGSKSQDEQSPSPSPEPELRYDPNFKSNDPMNSTPFRRDQYKERYEYLKHGQEFKKQALIEKGLMDPDGPMRPTQSVAKYGLCEDMCPEFERVRRIFQNDLKAPEYTKETAHGPRKDRMPDESRMVAAHHRSSAGEQLTLMTDLRTPGTLLKTMKYLVNRINEDDFEFLNSWIWDRSRAVRVEIGKNYRRPQDVVVFAECYEICMRFHLASMHEMSRSTSRDYDYKNDLEQLTATSYSMRQLWKAVSVYDSGSVKTSPLGRVTEPTPSPLAVDRVAEFYAYNIILGVKGENHRPELKNHRRIRAANALVQAAERTKNWTKFWALVKSDHFSYLMACAAATRFNHVRKEMLEDLVKNYMAGKKTAEDWTMQNLVQILGFDDDEQLSVFCSAYGGEFDINSDGLAYLQPESLNYSQDQLHGKVGVVLQDQFFSQKYVACKPERQNLGAALLGQNTEGENSLFVPESESATKANPFTNAAAQSLGSLPATASSAVQPGLFDPSKNNIVFAAASAKPTASNPFANVAANLVNSTLSSSAPALTASAGGFPSTANTTKNAFGLPAGLSASPTSSAPSAGFAGFATSAAPSTGLFKGLGVPSPSTTGFNGFPASAAPSTGFAGFSTAPAPALGVTESAAPANVEDERKKAEEAQRKAREEQERKAREEQERKVREEQERKAQEARQRALEEQRRKAEEEQRRRIAEEQARAYAAEQQRLREEQERERLRLEEEAARRAAEQRSQALETLAKNLMEDPDGGLMKQYLQNMVAHMVEDSKKTLAKERQAEMEALAERMYQKRRLELARCTLYKWYQAVAKRQRQAEVRKIRQRRRDWKAKIEAAKSTAASSTASPAAPAVQPTAKADSDRPVANNHDKGKSAAKPPTVKKPAASKTVSKSIPANAASKPRSSTQQNGESSKRPSLDYSEEYYRAREAWKRTQTSDRTETDWFKLRAMGIDPSKHGKRSFDSLSSGQDQESSRAQIKRPRHLPPKIEDRGGDLMARFRTIKDTIGKLLPRSRVSDRGSRSSNADSPRFTGNSPSPNGSFHSFNGSRSVNDEKLERIMARARNMLAEGSPTLQSTLPSLGRSIDTPSSSGRPAYWYRESRFVPRHLYGQGPEAIRAYRLEITGRSSQNQSMGDSSSFQAKNDSNPPNFLSSPIPTQQSYQPSAQMQQTSPSAQTKNVPDPLDFLSQSIPTQHSYHPFVQPQQPFEAEPEHVVEEDADVAYQGHVSWSDLEDEDDDQGYDGQDGDGLDLYSEEEYSSEEEEEEMEQFSQRPGATQDDAIELSD